MKSKKTALKIFVAALCCAFFGVGVFLFTSCQHEHEFVWKTQTEAGCENEGLEIGWCKCGEIVEHVIGALGHKYGPWQQQGDGKHYRVCQNDSSHREEDFCSFVEETTDATCTEPGLKVTKCKDCGYVLEQEEIQALGHDYEHGLYQYAGDGKHHKTCSRCSQTEKDEACEGSLILSQEANCEQDGFKRYQCSLCDGIYDRELQPALGHEFPEEWTADPDKPGYHYRECKHKTMDECRQEQPCVLDEDVHAPTCTQDGYTVFDCELCSYTKTETALETALGHDYPSTWDYDTEKEGYHFHICQRQGCDEREEDACQIKETKFDPTCTQDGYTIFECQVCKHQTTKPGERALDHDWKTKDYDQNSHQLYCSRECGVEQKLVSHVFSERVTKNPTCTEDGEIEFYCDLCGHTHTDVNDSVKKMGHNWSEWEDRGENHFHQCQRQDCKQTELLAHDYTQSNICVCKHDALEYEENESKTAYNVVGIGQARSSLTLTIPGLYNKKPVTRIKEGFAYSIFPDSKDAVLAKEITIMSGVMYIEKNCFANMPNLEKITLPDTLQQIGDYSIYVCSKLTQIVAPENKVVTFGTQVFQGSLYLQSAANEKGLYILGNLMRVSPNFEGEFEIKEGTISIGSWAFSDCRKLTKVIIPTSLKYISIGAFYRCDPNTFTDVEYKGDVNGWLSIHCHEQYNASPLSIAENLHIDGAKGAIVIPDGVTQIHAGVFSNDDQITSVHIPASVKTIGKEAFLNCTKLSTVTIDENCELQFIGEDAFKGSAFFNNAERQNGLLMLGEKHLIDANQQTDSDLTLSDKIVTIASGAFKNNTKIQRIVLPASLLYIGQNAFAGSSLKQAKFDITENWLATNSGGASRFASGLEDETKAASSLLTNTGEWKRKHNYVI